MNELNIKSNEENTMIQKIYNTELLDILALKHTDVKLMWKAYYKENRPFYEEKSTYDGIATIKNKEHCLDCYDHMFYALLLNKDILKMFSATTISSNNHKEFVGNLSAPGILLSIIKKVYKIDINEESIKEISGYIKLILNNL